MKSKLLLFDLAVCSVWMLSLFGGRLSWTYPVLLFIALETLLRFVVSFSLYYREKRSWLPLALLLASIGLMVCSGIYCYVDICGIDTIASYFFCV